jgi:predicted DNA-binding transcriptional regulator AlpA
VSTIHHTVTNGRDAEIPPRPLERGWRMSTYLHRVSADAPEPRYLTSVEVAELCRTSPESVRFWRHTGKGPKSFKLGRRVLYDVEDVEAWIAEARNAATAGR